MDLHRGLGCERVSQRGPALVPGQVAVWHSPTGAVWVTSVRVVPGGLSASLCLGTARLQGAAVPLLLITAAQGISTSFCLPLGPTLLLCLGKKNHNKHTLQFAWNFSAAQAEISLYVLGIIVIYAFFFFFWLFTNLISIICVYCNKSTRLQNCSCRSCRLNMN